MRAHVSAKPLIAMTLKTLPPTQPIGVYDSGRQLFVDGSGRALLDDRELPAVSVRTFTEKDPAEPPKPPKPPTITRVVQEPTDVGGIAAHWVRLDRPDTVTKTVQDPGDPTRSIPLPARISPWGDNIATGAVGF